MFNPMAALISCQTLRAWLYLSEDFDCEEPRVIIRDKRARWAGMLHLPQSLPQVPRNVSRHTTENGPCELVMISRGYAPIEDSICDVLDEEHHKNFQKISDSSKVYEFHNVLWIE